VAEVRRGDKGPTIVRLARNRSSALEVVFFDKDVYLSSGLDAQVGEYVTVRAQVARYHDKKFNRDRLQLVVSMPGQVLEQTPDLDQALEEWVPPKGHAVEAIPDNQLDQLKFDGMPPDDAAIGRARTNALQPD
jgi:hypothetical protein